MPVPSLAQRQRARQSFARRAFRRRGPDATGAFATPNLRAWQRRASPLSRYALLAAILLIVDASLYPFSGWRDMGVSPFAFLFEALPHSTIGLEFDIVINVVGYVPIGLLAVFALYPRVRGILAFVAATLLALVLSMTMEALQTYLPLRVSDKLDWLTNIAGGALGALFGLIAVRPVLDTGVLRALRQYWFMPRASAGLIVLVLGFAALLYPQPLAFGLGPLVSALHQWLGSDVSPNALGSVLLVSLQSNPLSFVAAQGLCAFFFPLAIALLALSLCRPTAPRRRLALACMALVVVTKTMATGMSWGMDHPLAWATPAVVCGLVGASGAALAVARCSHRTLFHLTTAAILCGLVACNFSPDDPYGLAGEERWAYGRFLQMFGITYGLSLLWPWIAVGYLSQQGRPREARV